MRFWVLLLAVSSALLGGRALAVAAPAAKPCALNKVADLPVRIVGQRVLLPGSIDGRPITVLIDTGAASSVVVGGSARALGLPLMNLPGVRMGGVGGVTQVGVTHVGTFALGETKVSNVDLQVKDEGGRRRGYDMLLGEDVLSRFDIEFDLAHQAVRLLLPLACGEQDMAYWAESYDEAPLIANRQNWPGVRVQLNGRPIYAILDSGASTSVATLNAARIGGIRLEASTYHYGGNGAPVIPIQLGAIDFTVGHETIHRTRLRFSDLFGATTFSETGSLLGKHMDDEPDMLLGFDFLKSHRVLISRSHHKIYFTYEGGPVFDIPRPAAPPVQAPAAPASPAGGEGAR